MSGESTQSNSDTSDKDGSGRDAPSSPPPTDPPPVMKATPPEAILEGEPPPVMKATPPEEMLHYMTLDHARREISTPSTPEESDTSENRSD